MTCRSNLATNYLAFMLLLNSFFVPVCPYSFHTYWQQSTFFVEESNVLEKKKGGSTLQSQCIPHHFAYISARASLTKAAAWGFFHISSGSTNPRGGDVSRFLSDSSFSTRPPSRKDMSPYTTGQNYFKRVGKKEAVCLSWTSLSAMLLSQ